MQILKYGTAIREWICFTKRNQHDHSKFPGQFFNIFFREHLCSCNNTWCLCNEYAIRVLTCSVYINSYISHVSKPIRFLKIFKRQNSVQDKADRSQFLYGDLFFKVVDISQNGILITHKGFKITFLTIRASSCFLIHALIQWECA